LRWSVCSGEGGQFGPARGGQFSPASGGQFDRFLHITPILVEAIKEQQHQIESQNEKIAHLEELISDMQEKIASSR